MKKIFKIITGIVMAAIVTVVPVMAGCSKSSGTVTIVASDSADISTDTSDEISSSDSNGGASTGDTSTGETSSDSTSGTSADNSSSGGTSNTLAEYTASGITADYNTADTATETYSVAQNLLSAVTIYASSQVEITTTTNYGNWGHGGSSTYTTYDREVYTGSGVIYSITDEYVYIVTCYHVVYSETISTVANEAIYMYLYGSEYEVAATSSSDKYGSIYDYGDTAIECTYIGGSWTEDVAVLRADKDDVFAINDAVREVTFCEDYSAGDNVTAIGNYGGEGISVTKGSVSKVSENIDLTLDTTNNFRVMRLDINIYSGNSGGGLFDENGYYIGMVNGMSTQYTNYAFAIPATIVVNSIENIIYYSDYKIMCTADLGLEVEAASSKYVYDSAADTGNIVGVVTVTSVTSGSAAASMGLEAGDIITAMTIDGTTYSVTNTYDIDDLLLIIFSNSIVSVTYTRGGESAQSASYTFTSYEVSQH